MLPERTIEAEDAFLQEMVSAAPDQILAAFSQAMEHTRPSLAARLLGLLDDDQIEGLNPADLGRARTAARMFLHTETDDRNAWYDEAQKLVAFWEKGRRRRFEIDDGYAARTFEFLAVVELP